MKKNSKRGLRIIAGISTVILMSPLFANSSVQVMLGNELNAHADTHAKTPVGDKSVHKAFTPKRKSQHAIDSSIKYSHKVPVLRVSLKPTNTNYFKKGDQIHFKFSSKNVNLKNLKASYQKSLPFSYKKVSGHELVLTFKKSLNSGLYGQAYAIPTKNKKMTTKVQGTFDKAKLDIKNGHIHSYKLTSRAHKAGSNTATQQNTANQQSTSTNDATTQQQSTNTNNATTQQQSTTTTSQATNNTGTTTGTQQAATSQQTQPSYTTSNGQQSSVSQTASTASNQSYVSTQGKAVAKSSTGGTTSTEANQPQASKVDASTSSTPAQTADTTDSSDQTQAQSTSTSSNQTTTNQTSATTATSSTDTQAAATDKSNVTTNSDGSISQSQQQNVNASDAYNTVLSRTKIKRGSSSKGYVSTPVPSASDPQTTYQKYASQQDTTTTGQTSETAQSGSTATTTSTTTSTTNSNNQSSQTSTAQTTAQANSTGTVHTAAGSQNTSTTDPNVTTTADSNNASEQNSEGEAIYNAVKKNVSDQTSTWASANEQGEIVKAYPWILKDIASKMAANQDTKGQVWKYAVPLTTGKTALVTIDGRSSTSKADEGTLAASMPALLKSIGSSSKTGMFDEAVDVDILKQSDYYKNLQTEQDNLENASAKDAYNTVLSSTTFTQDNGTLNTSKYVTAPTPNASDPKATYSKLAAEQQNGSNSSTTTTEDSDGTAIYNNIKTQVANQTQSWADTTEQGEIVKDYPWILNDIAKRMAVAGADDNQVWNYKIPLTTGKTALITINGQANVTSPSSLTASMPQLLKSLGSSATPDMFDDVVDSDILQNSHYYKALKEQSQEQAPASTDSGSSGGLGSIFGGGFFNPLSTISNIVGAFLTVSTIGSLIAIPVIAHVAISAAKSITNIVKVTSALANVALKAAPFIAPLFIIPALVTIGGIMLNAPLIIGGLLLAKPVIDAVVTIGTVITIGNVIGTIGTIGTLGTIGSAIALGTMGMIGTAVAVGAIAATALPLIFKTISHIASGVASLANLGTFIAGFLIGSINAVTTTMSVLGHLGLTVPLLAVTSIANPVLSVVSALAFAILTGNILNLGTGLANVPLLAGFAIGASLVTLIVSMLGRQLFNSATSAINKFIQGAKNVIQALALGSIIPAFVLAPMLIKIAMAFLALIPLAGWALKKFFDNIRSGLNALRQFSNVIFVAAPLTAIVTTVAATVTKAINQTGSIVTTTLGPLAVRLVVGALTLDTLPLTTALGGLPFVVINMANRLFRDLVTGTVKLVAKVNSLAANVVTNIESQIQQVIKTVVSPVLTGAALLTGLLFIIPAITGIKILTSPILAILSLPLTILTNILVPSIANLLLPAIALIGTAITLPLVSGLVGLPLVMLVGTGLHNIVSSILNLPLLLLGNDLLSWFPAFLAGSIAQISSLLKNGLPLVFNALISFGAPLVLLPLQVISSAVLGLILPFGLKWLALAPVGISALVALGSQLKWVLDAIKGVIGTVIKSVLSVINTHLLLVALTIVPTILSSIFNTLFGFGPLSVIGDLINTLNKMFVNNFMLPQFVAFAVKLGVNAISGILKAINNGIFNLILNVLKGIFHLKGITGLLGLLFGIPTMLFQGLLNNLIPDIISTLAGLFVLAFNLFISTPLMFLGGIGSALGRLLLINLLTPILQLGNDLISWLPALTVGTLLNVINLFNGLVTQGPVGIFLFGFPLVLNAGLLLANLLAIPAFSFNLIGNFFGLSNLLSLIFPLIAALLLGAELRLMSGFTTILNVIGLLGQLVLSGLTMPLWLVIPGLNLVRKLAFWTTNLLGLPNAFFSFIGNLGSQLLKGIWSTLTSLPSTLIKALLSFGANVISTLIKDTLLALGAGLIGLSVLGGLNLAGKVISTLLQLAKFFLVTLPLTIGGVILSILGLLVLNGVSGLGLILLSNTLLNGLALIITASLLVLPALVSQFISNAVKTFSLAAVLTLNLFQGLLKIGNRLVMDFVLGFLNLLNFAVKAVAGLPTLFGVLATIVTAILPVPGHLLVSGILLALTAGSILAKLVALPLDLLTNALNLLKIGQLLLTIPVIIVKFIGAVILSQLIGGLTDLLLFPVVLLKQVIRGVIGLVLAGVNGLIKLALPLVLGTIGLTLSVTIPLIVLGIRVLGDLLKNNPLLALIVLAVPGLIPGLNLILSAVGVASVFGLAKNGLKLLLSPITGILNLIKNGLIALLAFGALAVLGAGAGLLLGLPLFGLLSLGIKGVLDLAQLPLKIFNGFIGNLIPALIAGTITGVIRILTNGGLFGLLKLLVIIPVILNGLLTALIPVLNGITVPLALIAALIQLPLTLVEGLINNLNAGLLGLFGGQLVKGVLNFINGILNVLVPVLGILLAVMLPTLLIGLTANIVWIWFLASIVLNLAVDPITDFVGFMIMLYTMFLQPALYIVFGFITVPLTLLLFIGMFANWLNPLRFIFQTISDFGTWSLIWLGLGSFVAIELLKLSLVGLHLIPGSGLAAWLALTAAEIGLVALVAQFVLNTVPSIIYGWGIVILFVAIGAIVIFLQEFLNIGINVPSYLSYWILLPLAAILAVAGILMTLTLMLAFDTIALLTQLPLIVGNISFGLLAVFVTNPVSALLANVVFGVIGVASIVAFIAGAFMVGQTWLAAVFPFDLFIYYLIMQNPIWELGQWAGLFPILGWIVALVDDILWMAVGTWIPGILAILNYSIFILTAVPLDFSAIIGVSLLLATGINGLLLLPVLLIGAALTLGLVALPIVIRYGLQMLPDLVCGVGVNIVFNWFLGPLFLELAVNPVADFVGFMIMLYTMFTQPLLYYGFGIFLIPATILMFNGMFINWLNPLHYIFDGISGFAKFALPTLALLGIGTIDLLRLSAGLISLIPGVGLITAFTLGLAKWALIGLVAAYVINTIPSILAGAAIVFLLVGIGAIVIVLQEVLNIGINVPSYLSYWVLLPMAVILTVTAILITLPLMLRDDFNVTLLALPFIVNNLGLGLITGLIANPLAGVIAAIAFGAIGMASIPAFLAGSFMIAETWLSSVFPLELFAYYLIMQNPIWEMANWIGLFPIIGWIVALIVDVVWMIVGTWVPGMFAILNYAIFIATAVPMTFSAIIGVSMLLSLGLVGLLGLPINLIGGAILLGVLVLPSIISTVLNLVGGIFYGIAVNIIFTWFLGPIALDLAVDPIADFIGYVIQLYTMFEQPLLYWVFGAISIPTTALFFIGMFTNWLNPLRILFQGLTDFAKFALPTIFLLSFAAVVGLQISDLLISIVPGMGLLASLGLFNGIIGLIGLIAQYVINVIPSILALSAIAFLVVGIGAIVIILQEVLNIGINVPSYLSFWVLLPMAAVLGVLSVILVLPSMLVGDLFATLLDLPFIVGNLGLGLLESFLANPIAAILAALNFGILGVASIPAFFIGTFMIAQSWLSSVFPIPEFLYYLVMNNPIWEMANWVGLIPIIGWIVALIVDVLWLVVGVWGTGIMSVLNYSVWALTTIPLVFSMIAGVSLLLSLGLLGIVAAPILLLGGAILLGLLAIPSIIKAVVKAIASFVYGIAANIIFTWFLGPITLDILVNPITDAIGFIIMLYTMFSQPVLYIAFAGITVPVTFLLFAGTFMNWLNPSVLYWGLSGIFIPATLFFFQGSFTNWLNPLNNLFQGITNFAYLALPLLAVLGLGTMDLFRLAVNVISLVPGVGLIAGLALFNAKWLLIGLIGLYVLNAIPSILALAFIVFIVVGIGAIVIFLQEFLNIGINVPSTLSYWILLPMAAFLGVGITLITLPLMLAGDLVATLIALPGIVGSLGLALTLGFVANPLAAILAALNFAILGIASIPAFLAGSFMIAQSWLGSVFPIELFVYYLIMQNPIWSMARWIGLIPIIGWVVALIVDIIWMIVGTWVPGMFALWNYAIFIMTAVPLTFSTVIGLSMLLSLGLPGLILIPLAILINLLPIGLIALPSLLPAMLISGVVNPLLNLLKNVASFITGGVVALAEKLFGNNLLNSLFRTVLNAIVLAPKGLIGMLLTLPAWIMAQVLKLNDFLNKALAGLWSLISNIVTGLIFSIPGALLSSLGNLILSPITTGIISLVGLSVLGLLNLLNPLTSLILPLIGAGLVALALTVGQNAKFMGNLIKAALSGFNLILPAINLLRRIGVIQAASQLLKNAFDVLNDLNPLKLFADFLKNVILPMILFATGASIAQTIIRLLGMPLLNLIIPVIAAIAGAVISVLMSPLALLVLPLIAGIAALIPLVLAHMKSMAQIIPDLIVLIGQLLVNGALDLAKLLLSPLALFTWPLIGLVDLLKNVFNGQHPLLNVFEKMNNVLKDLLGPLSALFLDGMNGLANILGAGLSFLKFVGSLLLPIFPMNWLLAFSQVPKQLASLINGFKGLGNIAGDILNDLGRLALSFGTALLTSLLMPLALIGLITKGLTDLTFNLFKSGLSLLFQGLERLFNNGIKFLFSQIPAMFKNVLGGLGNLLKLGVLALPDVLNPLYEILMGAMSLGGLIPAVVSLLGLPFTLFIKPVLDLINNNVVPIAAFLGLSLLNTLLNPITSVFGFLKSVLDTIKSQNKLNGVLKNVANFINTGVKGLQVLWLIGLALGSLVSHIITGAVALLTHLIASQVGKQLLNLAGLLFVVIGSNPLKSLGSFVSNVKKMWNTGQTVPKAIKGLIQGLMKIGSTFTFIIRGIKHLGDLLTGFAIVPGALGVLGFLRQVNQRVIAAPLQWLNHNLVLPLITNGLTGLSLALLAPVAFLPTLLLSLPGNRFGRLLLTLPLALLGNSLVQWLPTVVINGLRNLFNGGKSSLQNLLKIFALSGLVGLVTRGLSKVFGKFVTFGLLIPNMIFGNNPLSTINSFVKNLVFFKVFDKVVPLPVAGLLQAVMMGNTFKKLLGNVATGINSFLKNDLLFVVTAPIWLIANGLNQLGKGISNLFGKVANFFLKLGLLPLRVLSFNGVPEFIGNVIAGLGKGLTYPLVILNILNLTIPGWLLGRLLTHLLTHLVDLGSLLNIVPGFISGIGSVLFAPITNIFGLGKNILSGLFNIGLKGILDGLNTSAVNLVNAIESAISTVNDVLTSGLKQMIMNLVGAITFGIAIVGLSVLEHFIPTIKVPAWLDNLLKTIGQIAQTVLVCNVGILVGDYLIKNALIPLIKLLGLLVLVVGLLPFIGTGLLNNSIKQLGNNLKSFLLPLFGGLAGSLLGRLLNQNNNNNFNININLNDLPLLLALIPLMSTLTTLGNVAAAPMKLLTSILPGLIQTLFGGNKIIILPIIVSVIIPLIIPMLLAALLPVVLPVILAALLPVILPVIVLGLPVLVALIALLPVTIGIPLILSLLLPVLIPMLGPAGLIGFVPSLFGGAMNTEVTNSKSAKSSGTSVKPNVSADVPGLPITSGNSNSGGTNQVPPTGNNVGGNRQFPATTPNNNGNESRGNTTHGNGNNTEGAGNTQPVTSGTPNGMTTPKSTVSVPDPMADVNGLKSQKKLPQTNENLANRVLTVILGLILMLIDILGYVWISRRRKFSVD